MTALEEIKKALEGVTVQEWTFDGPANSIIIWCGEDTRVCFMTSDGPAKEHAKFITACNPASISELLSTLESLQRENEKLRKALLPFAELPDNAHGKNRYFLELLVCPDGDTPADGVKHYGESIRTARQALASTGGQS